MSTSTHFFRVAPNELRSLTVGAQHAVVSPCSTGIAVGDQLVFREWAWTNEERETGVYTGLWIARRATFVQEAERGRGIEPGFAVISLNNASENEWASKIFKRRLELAERSGVDHDRFWRIEERREIVRRRSSAPSSLEDESA